MKKAFTLIEMLAIITIIIILMIIISGGIKTIKTKSRIIQTHTTMEAIYQALTIYAHHIGTYPIITNIAEQYKLYDVLSKTLTIKDFRGKTVAVINKPALDVRALKLEGIIKQNPASSSHYFFYDAWGMPIIYMFGKISDSSGYSYNDQRVMNDGKYYNVNWPDRFDLISFGKDTLSNNEQTKNNDITNF